MILQGLAMVGKGINEYGVQIATGQPVILRWVHNPEESPDFGERYQQHIEPKGGRYVIHASQDTYNHTVMNDESTLEAGVVLCECPLVLPFNIKPGGGYDEFSWKNQLVTAFDGLTGVSLSSAIVRRGFDAVISVSLYPDKQPAHSSEIVLLHGFKTA